MSPQRPQEVPPHSIATPFAQSHMCCAEAPQTHDAAPAPGRDRRSLVPGRPAPRSLSLCMPLSPQRPEEVRPHSKSFAQSPIWCAEAPQAHVAAPAPGGFCVSRAGQGEAEALAGCGLGRAYRAPDRRRSGWKSASTRSSWGWCCARARRRRVPKGLAGSPASCASPPAAAPSAAPSRARRRSTACAQQAGRAVEKALWCDFTVKATCREAFRRDGIYVKIEPSL
jgi:hypothetical protein